MNTQYRKNLKAVLEASKSYCDESIESLKWELGTYDLSVDTNTDVAHIKTLPSGTIQTTVAKVDGVGYKVNQLVKELNSTNWSAIMSTATFSDGVATFTATAQNGNINQYLTSYLDNHKYLAIAQVKLTTANTNIRLYGNGGYLSVYSTATTDWQVLSKIFTGYSSEDRAFNIRDTRSSDWDVVRVKNAMLFDLTADFGSGNEPSTVSDCASAYLQRGINIYEYTPQQSSIKNNAFTGVTVEGANKLDVSNTTFVNGKGLNSSGVEYNNANMKSSTFIDISNMLNSGEIYYLWINTGNASGLRIWQYDNSYTSIEQNLSSSVSDTYIAFTLNTNTKYIRFSSNINETKLGIFKVLPASYVPYIQPTAIPIDLTTIKDSNNVSLFPSGKMMGNSSVADFITPYNQESRWNEVDLGTLNYLKGSDGGHTWFSANIADVKRATSYYSKGNFVCLKYEAISLSNGENGYIGVASMQNLNQIRVYDDNYANATTTEFKTAMSGVKLQYERATYLTSNTDLTSLTKINAESNGTIILNNTDNVDMPNTIKTLKEVAK